MGVFTLETFKTLARRPSLAVLVKIQGVESLIPRAPELGGLPFSPLSCCAGGVGGVGPARDYERQLDASIRHGHRRMVFQEPIIHSEQDCVCRNRCNCQLLTTGFDCNGTYVQESQWDPVAQLIQSCTQTGATGGVGPVFNDEPIGHEDSPTPARTEMGRL
jgi:hypothetical protein